MAEERYNKGDNKTIILERCLNGGHNCKVTLNRINQYLVNANVFIKSKDYIQAIEYKKLAFEETYNLTGERCKKCAGLFREIIYKSVYEYYKDIKIMTSGLFKQKRHLTTLNKCSDLLKIMKNATGHDTTRLKHE